MCAQINEIVDVTITRETLALSQTGFSTLLVAGDSDKLPAADVIVLTTDADLITGNVFSLKLNEELISETWAASNDATMAALAVKIQAKATVVTAVASGTPNRIITITAAGDETAPIIVTEAEVTLGATQAGVTNVRTPAVRTKSYTTLAAVAVDFAVTDPEYIAASIFFAQDPHPTSVKIGRIDSGGDWDDELTLINNADSEWYFLAVTTRTEADVKDVAAWADALVKQFHTGSADPDIHDSAVSSDIASFFENLEYDRAFTFFNELAASIYPEVALISKVAVKEPGTVILAYQTLTGVTPSDTLTDAQRSTVLATKKANLYTTIGAVGQTREGWMANGEYSDIVWGADYLESQMTINVFAVISAADKIPYADEGVATVETAVRATLDDFIESGYLTARPDLYDGQPYRVTVPKVADVSQADKANRLLPDITFRATLAGAIQKVTINGVVAV